MSGFAGGNTWTGPRVAPEFDLGAALEAQSWSVGVAGGYSRSWAETAHDERRANLELWVGRTSGCAHLVDQAATWQLRSCAFFEAGALKARGDASSRLSVAHSVREPWLALGIHGSLGSPPLFRTRAVLDLGGTMPILRHAFTLEDPPAELFQVPTAGFFLRLGIAVEVAEL